MATNTRTLLCAVPQPVADARECRNHRPLRLLLALGLAVGLQGMTSGPAAVATLPSALIARPLAPVPQPAPEAKPIITASLEYTPELGKDPALFGSILENAFPLPKPRFESALPAPEPVPAKPEPPEMSVEAVEDPDEIIPFGGRNIPRWLVHAILRAAHVTGVDPIYMMTLADVESSLSPEAKAPTSSAEGLFQFIDRTWLETVHRHAADYGFDAAAAAVRVVDGEPVVGDKEREWIMSLRTDPYFSALMAGELIKDMERALHAQGERELAEAELYLAHFLGASSAVRFLEALDESPNTKASKLFPRAARANAGLFMEGKGRKRRPVSVAELYNKIDSKIVRRMDRYGSIGPYLNEITRPVERVMEASTSVE